MQAYVINKFGNYRVPVHIIALFRPTDNIQGVENVRVSGWLGGVQSIFGSFGQNTLLPQTHDPFLFLGGRG